MILCKRNSAAYRVNLLSVADLGSLRKLNQMRAYTVYETRFYFLNTSGSTHSRLLGVFTTLHMKTCTYLFATFLFNHTFTDLPQQLKKSFQVKYFTFS